MERQGPAKPGTDSALAVSAWEEIVSSHQKYIFNLAWHLCSDPDEADDITQETFLKAFENLPGFRQEASLSTWLSRIALNIYLGKKRKKAAHVSITLDVMTLPDWSGNPERTVIKRELQWCIRHILQHHLPQSYRVVLVLRDLKGLSYGEIAGVLGISPGAVKSRLHRARQAYKKHLLQTGCAALVKDYSCYCEGVRKV